VPLTTQESAGHSRYAENSAASRLRSKDPFLPGLKARASWEKSGDTRQADDRIRAVYKPGESFTLPETVGAAVELETDQLLGPAEPTG
jgi:hypothetical protein